MQWNSNMSRNCRKFPGKLENLNRFQGFFQVKKKSRTFPGFPGHVATLFMNPDSTAVHSKNSKGFKVILSLMQVQFEKRKESKEKRQNNSFCICKYISCSQKLSVLAAFWMMKVWTHQLTILQWFLSLV